MPECSHFDRRHSDIVVRGDDGVEFASQRAHEHCVRRVRASHSGLTCRGRQNRVILTAESATVTGMRIQRA
jgi:hypothetical protein